MAKNQIMYIQYLLLKGLFAIVQILPNWILICTCKFLANAFFYLVKKRRKIAIKNITLALKVPPKEAFKIAKKSFESFVMTFFEAVKIRKMLTKSNKHTSFLQMSLNSQDLLQKALKIHKQSNGCIFLTPHLGNWEILPFAGTEAGIDIVAIVRPIDNPYIERFIYQNRTATGQGIISRRNAFYKLIEALKQGKSIGMLPDQSTMKGIIVDFFGMPASTTPLPALLAIKTGKPIVVTACYRTKFLHYDGFISEPLYAKQDADVKDEILRVMTEVNTIMQEAILKAPEQYLWMHNRWKSYQNKKAFLQTAEGI